MPKRTRADGDVMDDDPALAGSENGGDGGARSETRREDDDNFMNYMQVVERAEMGKPGLKKKKK